MPIVLLDTNVLLPLSDGASAEQSVAEHAVSRLRLRGDHPYITAQNIIEFWAVATRPLDANGLGWSTQQAVSHRSPKTTNASCTTVGKSTMVGITAAFSQG